MSGEPGTEWEGVAGALAAECRMAVCILWCECVTTKCAGLPVMW